MATLLPAVRQQFLDDNGKPISGGKVYTYGAGTSTPRATYTDQTGDTENTNPIILDAAGYAQIWMGSAFLKLVITDPDDVIIHTIDGVSAGSGGGGGGGGIPAGGDLGDVVMKLSSFDGDADWQSFNYSGVSLLTGAAWSSTGIKDTLDKIIRITYTAPTVSLTAAGSTTVREKGDAVTSVLLTAAVTKKSDPIAAVRFYKDAGLIHTVGSPNPAGGNETYTWSGSFSDNVTFSTQVDDNGATGGPSTVSNSKTFTYVYPYYNGAGVAGKSAAQVALLTKSIITSTATLAKTMTASASDVFYFAYPSSYGALTSILDVNNFETIGDWTRTTQNITGLDASAQSYYIYEFNNPVTAGSYQYTFKR